MTQTLPAPSEAEAPARTRRLAIVASKGTLDQAYPPLILASTAVSMGWEAGIYFTFYGLDILHKERFEKLKVASLANPAGPIRLPNLMGGDPRGDRGGDQDHEEVDGRRPDAHRPRIHRDVPRPRGPLLRLRHHHGGDGSEGVGSDRRL